MARRHSRLGGIVSFGNLPLVNDSVKGLDVIVGAAVGFVGASLVKVGLQKILPPETYAKVAQAVGKFLPALTGLSAAAILYYAQKGMNRSRAAGHAIGAAALGVGLTVAELLKGTEVMGMKPFDASPVALDLSGYGGLLVNDNSGPAMNGLIVDDTSGALNQLGAMSMGEDGGDYADVVELSRIG